MKKCHRQSKIRLWDSKYQSDYVDYLIILIFMFRKSILALSAASLATLIPLNAEDKTKGIYFTGSVGIGQTSDIDVPSSLGAGTYEFTPGYSGQIGLGYDFGNFRTEISYSDTNTDLSKIQQVGTDIGVNITSLVFSAAYDFRSDKKWQPYVGAGIGSATIDVNPHNGTSVKRGNVTVSKGDDSVTTTRLNAGLNYVASNNLDIYGELWGQTYEDFTIGTLTFDAETTTGVSLGVRFKL